MVPIFKPYMPAVGKAEAILHSGALTYGKYTRQFEKMLGDYFQTPYLIVVNSFQNAVSIALAVLGISYGDSVIASPMACLASTQPYLLNGVHVKWCDVDPERGTLDPDRVEKSITKDTRAIIHNHFCGYPGHIDEINAIGHKHGIPVIDDGIECFGTKYKGKLIGSCGSDVTIFSCSPVRIPNCIEGGIIIFKESSTYEKSLLLRDSGIDRAKFRDNLGEIDPACDIAAAGYSAMMSELNGYIGACQMEYVDELLSRQRTQALRWDGLFEKDAICQPIRCYGGEPNYWVYGILAQEKRKTIQHYRGLGYYASGVHIRNDVYSVFGRQNVQLPGTDEFMNRFVALPCGWWME